VAYLSTPGVDASAPISDSAFGWPSGFSVVVGWTEGTAAQAVARAATILPGPDPATTTASLSGVGQVVSQVTVDQGGLLGPGVAWVTGGILNHVVMRGLDVTPPLLDVRLPEFHRETSLDVSWSALDDWSPIDAYEYRYKVMKWDRQGATRTPWRSTAVPFSVKRVRNGNSYCVSVRATDVLGRTTIDYAGSCTTTPIDDRDLDHRGGWTARRGSSYFNGTFLETQNRGATITLPHIPVKRNIYVMLGVGPGQGKVRLDSAEMSWIVDLDRKRAKAIKVGFGLGLSGPFSVTVISTSQKVRVDGVLAQPVKLRRCDC
jgi:hypothetical protein